MTTTTEPLTTTTAARIAEHWLESLAAAAGAGDVSAVAELFLDDGWWRDIAAFTWDLRTAAGARDAAARLVDAWPTASPSFCLDPVPPVRVQARGELGECIEVFLTFETAVGVGRGHLRLAEAEGRWRAWTFATALEDLRGHEERSGGRRVRQPAPHGPARSSGEADVLVLGAGQSGLAVAARLGALDVSTVVVERHARVGDNWRMRYQSLVLHNTVWANHLPYLPFPETWPVYVGKDDLADWLEVYAQVLGIDVRTSTTLRSATYDDAAGRWQVTLDGPDGTWAAHPRHVVVATGVLGPANRPELPGRESFAGTVTHAADYDGGAPFRGSRVLVVGSGSSAHDVALDLHESGARVTMLQRSSTCVVSLEPGAARAYAIYRQDGPRLEDADLVSNSFPYPLLATLHREMTREIAEMDAELLDGLRAAGFALDFGEDGSGFLMKHQRQGGGYYINVGCSDLIVSGDIAVVQGASVTSMSGRTVHFSDGSSVDVDHVVVAAGYRNMSETIRQVFGDDVAERVGPVWGMDDEGELRAMWRPTGQAGLWIMGGSLQQARSFSKYLAVQLKARLEGLVPAAVLRRQHVSPR